MAPYNSKVYTVKVTVDGKPYYIRGKTKREAREKAALKKAELQAGIELSRDMSVKDWAEKWAAIYKEGKINDRYLADIKSVLDKRILPAIGSKKIKSVKPADLQAILNDLAGQYSDSYIKKVKDIIKGLFGEACNNDLILKDPARGLKSVKAKEKAKRRAITQREREITLKTAETSRGGLFVLIMLYAGLRPGEVAALRWNDIDMDKKVLHVRHALKADGSIGDPKSKAGIRDVPVPSYLYDRLAAIEHGPFDLVCVNSQGGHYTESSIERMWKTFKRDMNITAGCKMKRNQIQPPYFVPDDLTLYCYRHTYATDLQAAGVPINVAKELMGHSSIEVTASCYTHQSDDSFADAAAKIEAYSSEKVAKKVAKNAEMLEISG